MNDALVRKWFEHRFGNPDTNESYYKEWCGRFAGLSCESLIPIQMDFGSRRAWGRVTGRRYAIVKYNYDVDPVFEVVDLKTGLTSKETDFLREEARPRISKAHEAIDADYD